MNPLLSPPLSIYGKENVSEVLVEKDYQQNLQLISSTRATHLALVNYV